MLKRITIKKMLITSTALVALFLIYLIPSENTYHLEGKQNLEYVNKNIAKADVFLLSKKNLLTKVSVTVESEEEPVKRALELIEYLKESSKLESKIPSGFKPYLQEDVKVENVKLEGTTLKVEFDSNLLNIDEKLEEKMIEGIVYTLTSIEGVDRIVLYVDGKVLTKLPKSKINLPSALDRNIGINKEYSISSYKDIHKVTVYYLDSFNEDYYYVPVTKYINDDREKISIIIDELSGNISSNTNLMSFLNSNTRLMSYDREDDVLNLVFNQYIFDNVDEKSILEEVIYTICLSVKDNYDVNAVSFSVDSEEVYKSVLKEEF